jgi:hypothetical protein
MPRGIPNAKANPVAVRKIIEASEQPLGHTVVKTSAKGGVDGVQMVQVAERLPDPEKLANLAFMAELVTIRPATSTDPNAEQVFEITVNGKTELFRRGHEKTVHRYYVDLIARLKVTSFKDREVTNDEGIKQILHDPTTALKYDFAMIRDPNPMGESWLKATLAMAA